MSDATARECAVLEDVALVRALTVDKEQYGASYLDVVQQEMNKRDLVLSEVINDVYIAGVDDDGETVTIARALERVDADWALWSLLTIENYIGDSWVIQKEHSRWLIHFYEGDTYRFSFFYETVAQFKDLLNRFLSLEMWEVEDSHELNHWKPIFQTRSPDFLTKIVSDLDRGAILHTVKTPAFTHDKKGEYVLTVPRYHVKEGELVVAHAQQELAKLYDQAERLATENDREQELKMYALLVQIVPDNPAVHYNRGQVLLEMGKIDEAVEALGEAIVLGLPAIPEKVKLNAKRGGLSRMAGGVNPLMSLVVLAQQTNKPKDSSVEYPDYIDDCALLLERILETHIDHIPVRHCLATVAELKNDIVLAKKYYGQILAIDANDDAAKANLAYHEASETSE